MLKIETVRQSCMLGRSIIEGYVNGKEFTVDIMDDTHKIEFITVNDETVYAHDILLLEEPIRNPISAELMNEMRTMVNTKIRTIGRR